MKMLTLDDIQSMTQRYGEGWGYPHVQRVLKLIDLISEDVIHDADVMIWATYLHDWGAFPIYRQVGVPHGLRSSQIAEADILPQTTFDRQQKSIILEAIEKHDYQDTRPVESNEALLLREADWLDMLGGIGIVRDFAWGPNNLSICYERIMKYRDILQHRFTLPIAQTIAKQRLEHMDQFMTQLMLESFAKL